MDLGLAKAILLARGAEYQIRLDPRSSPIGDSLSTAQNRECVTSQFCFAQDDTTAMPSCLVRAVDVFCFIGTFYGLSFFYWELDSV